MPAQTRATCSGWPGTLFSPSRCPGGHSQGRNGYVDEGQRGIPQTPGNGSAAVCLPCLKRYSLWEAVTGETSENFGVLQQIHADERDSHSDSKRVRPPAQRSCCQFNRRIQCAGTGQRLERNRLRAAPRGPQIRRSTPDGACPGQGIPSQISESRGCRNFRLDRPVRLNGVIQRQDINQHGQ